MYRGIMDANPNAKLISTWTNEWVNHELEHFHADLHFNHYDVSVITQDTDTFEPQFLANQVTEMILLSLFSLFFIFLFFSSFLFSFFNINFDTFFRF